MKSVFLAIAICIMVSVNAQAALNERCGVITDSPAGESEIIFIDGFSVLALLEDEKFELPSNAPKNVEAVECGRESLLPVLNDYLVLAAGYPLFIVANDRIGVLEVEDGRVQFRMVDGEMTEKEVVEGEARLDGIQEKFNSVP